MASQTPDDGFHEIQLNGKQLVFLFMAATVVSVVIFLCGVLVGRGVRAERAASVTEGNVVAIEPAGQPVTAPAPSAGTDPTAATAPPTVDELTYYNRLEKQAPPADDLKAQPPAAPQQPPVAAPLPPAVAKAAPPVERPAPKAPVKEVAPKEAAALAPGPPAGDGYVIQVAAMKERGDADAMARRLSGKGYQAFVMAPGASGPAMYRVRVGKFKTRRDAETVAARLQKDEQFKPWITR